ncbi:MAG TPA: EAL domain-containing protein [Methylophilaceae bacterium]|nr:EAL domain-containing protein [Methylophilaceae bacterium]
MLEGLHRQIFAPGEVIFHEGESGDCAYLIEAGLVEVCIGGPGRQSRISLLGSGELIGEVALIDRQKRTATVRALRETIAVPIARDMVEELLEKTDPLIRHLLRVILGRFRNTQGSLTPQLLDELGMVIERSNIPESLRHAASYDLSLAQDIAHALLTDQFEMHYQPICRLSDSKIVGYEALIRWQHPREGMLPPLEFLWLAERTGQVRAIGLWTLERACRDWPILRAGMDVEAPFISVNLSASQLTGNSLVEDVRSILVNQNMRPSELKLELTENIIIGRPEIATQILTSLMGLGGSLALDDFGTAYSGLDYLQRFPIGTIKIDRLFISQVLTSPVNEEIVRSSVNLAHSLGMDVVAEGVESEETRDKLLQLDCNFGQGWLFGKAAALEKICA